MPSSYLYPQPLVHCHVFIKTPCGLDKFKKLGWAELNLTAYNISSSFSNVTLSARRESPKKQSLDSSARTMLWAVFHGWLWGKLLSCSDPRVPQSIMFLPGEWPMSLLHSHSGFSNKSPASQETPPDMDNLGQLPLNPHSPARCCLLSIIPVDSRSRKIRPTNYLMTREMKKVVRYHSYWEKRLKFLTWG